MVKKAINTQYLNLHLVNVINESHVGGHMLYKACLFFPLEARLNYRQEGPLLERHAYDCSLKVHCADSYRTISIFFACPTYIYSMLSLEYVKTHSV